jgi:hypothetical protein
MAIAAEPIAAVETTIEPMPGLRLVVVTIAAGVALGAPPSAAASAFDFKTPGEAAYCRMEFTGDRFFAAFRCITPNDGFWVRISGRLYYTGSGVRITKGYSPRFKGYRERMRVIGFGATWATSDAEVITCRSRRSGLTCRHPMSGLTFWLGRYRGYRIYRTKRGFPIRVQPLFRTSWAWCGLNLESDNPLLLCWHPASSLEVGVAHDHVGRVEAYRDAWARAYRPRGFHLVRAGARVSWRCRIVTKLTAGGGCSTRRGVPVFTCAISATRIRCTNRSGRGFVLGRRGRSETF